MNVDQEHPAMQTRLAVVDFLMSMYDLPSCTDNHDHRAQLVTMCLNTYAWAVREELALSMKGKTVDAEFIEGMIRSATAQRLDVSKHLQGLAAYLAEVPERLN